MKILRLHTCLLFLLLMLAQNAYSITIGELMEASEKKIHSKTIIFAGILKTYDKGYEKKFNLKIYKDYSKNRFCLEVLSNLHDDFVKFYMIDGNISQFIPKTNIFIKFDKNSNNLPFMNSLFTFEEIIKGFKIDSNWKLSLDFSNVKINQENTYKIEFISKYEKNKRFFIYISQNEALPLVYEFYEDNNLQKKVYITDFKKCKEKKIPSKYIIISADGSKRSVLQGDFIDCDINLSEFLFTK